MRTGCPAIMRVSTPSVNASGIPRLHGLFSRFTLAKRIGDLHVTATLADVKNTTGSILSPSVRNHGIRPFFQGISFRAINPFYLQGDFDSDGQPDYALRITAKNPDSEPEDIVLLSSGGVRWLSKDIEGGYPGPSWCIVFKNEEIPKSPFEGE